MFRLLIGFVVTLSVMAGPAHGAEEFRPPNILFIMTDEQRADALGAAGNAILKTPNIDGLAKTGIRFANAYVNSPLCSPNRISLYTGRYVHTHRVRWNTVSHTLSEDNKTIAQVLKEQGYKTACFGKMHITGHTGHDLGFGDAPEDNYQYRDYAKEKGKRNSYQIAMKGKHWTGKLETSLEDCHETIITDKAMSFMEEHKDGPFFVWLSYFGPHMPYAAPDPYYSMYKPEDMPPAPKPPEGIKDDVAEFHGWLAGKTISGPITEDEWLVMKAQYYGLCTYIDDEVGRVVAKLKKMGVYESTIIVYTSDHGDMLGDHTMFAKGIHCFDGTAKVPYIIRVPGMTDKGQVSETLVQSIDLMPTLLDLVKAPLPAGVQGKSLVPILKGEVDKVNDAVYAEVGPVSTEKCVMMRAEGHKYIYYTDGSELLFDMKNDPNEFTNLAGKDEHKDLLAEMRLKMLEWRINSEDPLPGDVKPPKDGWAIHQRAGRSVKTGMVADVGK
ncbi:sulfatase [Candidatus Hydrogenedentota bacterium]